MNLDSQEILAEEYNVNAFLARVDAVLREREYREFNEGLNSKLKSKNCLQGVGDPGPQLMFGLGQVVMV